MLAPLITMTTDFGLRDGYVGAMRGVILGLCPAARLMDITHQVPPQDLRHASAVLRDAVPWFPAGAVHLGVIDPGVGTARRAIVARAAGHTFVGPDNGLFVPVLDALGGEIEAWEITEEAFLGPQRSSTFHGRDIFAPVAAHLALGVSPGLIGPPIADLVPSVLSQALVEGGRILGQIVSEDHFGNLTTDILATLIPEAASVVVRWPGRALDELKGLHKTYGERAPGGAMVLIGSSGYIEIAVNQGSARRVLGIGPGDEVEIDLNG